MGGKQINIGGQQTNMGLTNRQGGKPTINILKQTTNVVENELKLQLNKNWIKQIRILKEKYGQNGGQTTQNVMTKNVLL